MIKFFILFLLLVYFWYWTSSTSIQNILKPTFPEPIIHVPTYKMETDQNNFHFLVDNQIKWSVNLPKENIFFDGNKFSDKDDCFGIPDGHSIVATGKKLYDYIKTHDVASKRTFQVFAAADFLRHGNVFYFTCRGNRIDQLNMCESGEIFINNTCQKMNACLDKPQGFTFANVLNLSQFYECPGNEAPAILHDCEKDKFFFYDACRPLRDYDIFCQNNNNNNEIVLIDPSTRLICLDNERATFHKCPQGQLYFDGKCESSECVGKPDDTRIGAYNEQRGPFHYHAGYIICKNHRIHQKVKCPTQWDKNRASDLASLSLPMVFNGIDCVSPEFCTNFQSDDTNLIVPVYDFLKHVRNWQFSSDVDKVKGYVCDYPSQKNLKTLVPGNIIDNYKIVSSDKEKTFLSSGFEGYYDTKTKSVVSCQHNFIFDGIDCRPKIENAFEHGGLGLFQMSDQKWIPGWSYVPKHLILTKCDEPESEFLKIYNACSHPDCVKYPFLSQAKGFFIALEEEGKICVGENKQLVSKKDTAENFDYWTQSRNVSNSVANCIPGSKIQSGNFIFDSMIYATCDHTQPFVFCPYKNNDGIVLLEGKYWACKPNYIETVELEKDTYVKFIENELRAIRPKVNNTWVEINNTRNILNSELLIPKDTNIKLWASENITLVFRYVLTFPPNVAFRDGKNYISTVGKNGALVMKREGFTTNPVTLPKFENLADSISQFDKWSIPK